MRDGTVLAPGPRMQTRTPVATSPVPLCLVRWIFRQGPAAITCEVDVTPDRAFEIAVIPSASGLAPLRERFPHAVSAMERHAEIASSLRDAGWIVSSRSMPALGATA